MFIAYAICFVKKRSFVNATKKQPSGCENGMINGCSVSYGLHELLYLLLLMLLINYES